MLNNKMQMFHQMEIRYHLFDIDKENKFPLWDLLRVYVYNNYIAKNEIKTLPPLEKTIGSTWVFISDFLRLLFRRHKVVFIQSARELREGKYYDKISDTMIENVSERKRIIIDTAHLGKTEKENYHIQILGLMDYLCPVKDLQRDYFSRISGVVKETFDVTIPYDTINNTFKKQVQLINRYELLFKLIKPTKLFISCDLNKPAVYAAKQYGIRTYEMQHAGIVFEYPSYSYPKEVSSNWNIVFADSYLMLGKGWANVNSIPTIRKVIGNDYFVPSKFQKHFEEDYIVVVSTELHYEILTSIAKQFALANPSMIVVYKLHPDEYKDVDKYKQFFQGIENIHIVCNEINLQDILYFCKMVVLIYSSVCFEALNYNKRVAVIPGLNSDLMLKACERTPNVKLVHDVKELIEMVHEEGDQATLEYGFYEPFDNKLAKQLLTE